VLLRERSKVPKFLQQSPEKLKVLLLENRKEETKFIRTCVGID
jgi:hypothetical protein